MKHFVSWFLLQGNYLLKVFQSPYKARFSFLIMKIFLKWSRIQQQQEVLVWLLEPLSQQWIQLQWQNNYLSEPLGLVRLCSETAFMWSLFHAVTFFEKALKRSGMRKGNFNLQNSSTAISTPHPIASHLSWMLPPLLKVCYCV